MISYFVALYLYLFLIFLYYKYNWNINTKMVPMHKDSRVTIGKYKILDIDKGFSILASTDDFDEAIEWVTEYRLNGRKVKIQREDLK